VHWSTNPPLKAIILFCSPLELATIYFKKKELATTKADFESRKGNFHEI
jgi:hypothetical protein